MSTPDDFESSPGARRQASSSRYWSGAHTKHRLVYHLVWIPKYRRRVLEGLLGQRVQELLEEGCAMHRWRLEELSVQPDHVHLLLQAPPSKSVPEIVQLLKGGSSHALRQEFGQLREFVWGRHFWAPGYFVTSIGAMSEEVVRRYIQEQQGDGEDE